MKQFLFDHTNWGIICVFNQHIRAQWEASIMRCCILDTNFGTAHPVNPEYNALNNNYIKDNFIQRSLQAGKGGFSRGSVSEINDLYLRKRELASLMYVPIARLVELLHNRTLGNLNVFGTPIDDVLSHDVLTSNPELNYFSPGVMEYAKTLGITDQQAYTELKIEYETAYAFKMRSFAFMKMFQAKIRLIENKADADAVLAEINSKLFIETMI
jgi:hypothetical protein